MIPVGEDSCVWAPKLIVDLCDMCIRDMRTWIREGVNR